ncbi:MAG: NCS2 family permease [Vallitaleaceae bacterium]|nr:NCS2 family permease [Vallitaleaceae bacterium]
MDKFFKLTQNKTNVRTVIFAGVTTFMTMAYIIVVNPNMLSGFGLGLPDGVAMDWGGVFVATILAAIIGTVMMALLANYPFALAPGMGLNAFFIFSVVLVDNGFGWRAALTAVFIEGIIFIILTFVNIREALFNSIPLVLKYAVSAGIGLFIAFIGFQGAGVVIGDGATLVTVAKDLTQPSIVLAIIGLLLTSILVVKKVKGSILIGILATWILAMIAEKIGWYVPMPDMNLFSVIPAKIVDTIPSIEPVFLKFDFSVLGNFDFWIIVFAFLFVDLFDTLGTLIGVSEKAGYLDQDGKLPKAKQALLADAIATTAGACLGTSTTTTYIESAAGVADGGRTGLTALTTAALFALALPFSPIFMAIPAFATAPALIIVGFYMMGSITKVNFTDFRVGIPAFLTVIVMPITYSISEGIAFGIISYTVINAFTGEAKKVHPLMYILSVAFILKYIFIV